MGVLEMEKETGAVTPVKSLAQKLYDKQIKDITNISHTNGYKEIKRYWIAVQEGAEKELKAVTKEHLEIVQMKCNIAEGFVTYLQNLESTVKVNKQSKI